ncbi:NAD dependent epimerase/dehydratase [Colletotrichum scovillei]|uniref:NAD dependent epimerase/dehydratase n=1 Tax=Colletotrichum scovillei TaxID=1209932 RepID=A0A9P7RBL0_9PEZI|nr:NAD dependent epimerase/dehydratase [Colletotrichum scovillei]KAF4777246.1 NAD dependent epimerase/dehydratase [Colletotrichum scovillei]KAG7053532.1 NAD dependent epimerase/dehydratase [Colletotrichum scovillei]KAG7071828.1 NAD dependent epimerase/dehydratase [Colletotrichum scovillei]KAG7080078.1 NAD dependent epimerase/dehydratase [Colletotrichum scovillei]
MPLRVLLTGANGFIAQHILAQFLEAGHSVRAVVRSQSSVDQLRKTFASYPSTQLDFALVPDIATPGAFDTVLVSDHAPFDVVLHTASPFNFRKGNSNADFLDPAVKGTTEILHGVVRKAPTVKRVIVTSSMAAVIDITKPPISDPPKIYSEEDWLGVSRKDAEASTHPAIPYVASKKFAEKAAWSFLSSEPKPAFDLVTICPPIVYGPLYDVSATASPQNLNESNHMLYQNLCGPSLTKESPVPPEMLHLYVDVRDVARAHLLAATTPEAGGKRFLVSPGGVSNQRLANVLREKLPQWEGRIPKGNPAKAALAEGMFGVDASLAEKVLGMEYRPLEDTIGDIAVQFVELENRANTA